MKAITTCILNIATAVLSNWQECPVLEAPEGAQLTCENNACYQICPERMLPGGARKKICHFNSKKGYFWRREFRSCTGCNENDFEFGVTVNCSTHRRTKVCSLSCPESRQKAKYKCTCSRHKGERHCTWKNKVTKSFLRNEKFSCQSFMRSSKPKLLTGSLQRKLDKTCMSLTDCDGMKFARFIDGYWQCVQEVDKTTSVQCINEDQKWVDCFNADQKSGRCIRHTELAKHTVRPISTVQLTMNNWCEDLARRNSACSRVKYARYSDFQWKCFERVYERLSFDCVDQDGNPQLCQAADVSSQSCTRENDLNSFMPRPQPKLETVFMSNCLKQYDHDLCNTIDMMNVWRRQFQVPDFEVPDKWLCDEAQKWSNKMATDQMLKRSKLSSRLTQGENVAAGAAVITTFSLAAKRWQAEEKWWDHDKMEAVGSPRKRNSDCVHFTQNMWKSTRQVCFAKSRSKSNIVYITARFWPRGNIAHQWRENLLPPLE